jgi:hypothetical protein
MKNYRTFFHVPITCIPLSSSLMKYLTLPFPSSTLLALYPQMYTPNLPTPINTFCLAAVILLMWLRAYHTVKLLESGEFAPPTNLWKNDWVNLKIIWKEGVTNKVLSRKVLTKLITSPGAAYFSTKKNRNVCVLTYHPCLRNSFNTIRGHWTTVEKKSKLSKVFPEPPMVAFKQPNNLRNLLVRAEMSKPNTTIGKSHSCGDKRCKCCKHMQHSSSYTSKVTGKQYKIFCTVNCKSANVIYILERLNGHRSDLTKKTFLPVSQHSRLSDHSLEDFNRMKILIIEQNCLWSDFQRENREIFWMKELRVLHPDGINRKQ